MMTYLILLEQIRQLGHKKNDRTGTGTTSLHAVNFRHDVKQGFPLLTTKFVSLKSVLTEWKWMMMGITDVKYLQDNGCTIWDEWATVSQCQKFQRVVGDLGPIYGHQWRNFGATRLPHAVNFYSHFNEELKTWLAEDEGLDADKLINPFELRESAINRYTRVGVPPFSYQARQMLTPKRCFGEYFYGYNDNGFDQVAWLIKELKFNHNSRRLIVSGWNPKEANEVALPPCHTLWQMQTHREMLDGEEVGRPTLNLSLHQRSADSFLGLPYNIAFYAFTIEFFSMLMDMIPGELSINGIDGHLYSNHHEQVDLQQSREPYPLPKLVFDPEYRLLAFNFFNSIEKNTSLAEIGFRFTKLVNSLKVGEDVYVENYEHHPSIKADVAV